MDNFFEDFLERYRGDCSYDEHGTLRQKSDINSTIASDALLESLATQIPGESLPQITSSNTKHFQMANWILALSKSVRAKLDLSQELPPPDIHYVPSATELFYDLRNTDIILEELMNAGIEPKGKLLDFGCSSGRNIATLHRCFGDRFELFGVDPVATSIKWAQEQFQYARFAVSNQEPPLSFEPETFDLVLAKSIWTHFNAGAAKKWFQEVARIMKTGGHFFFSTHGPHDIAYRLIYNKPQPLYDRYSGSENWTKETFLMAVIKGLDNEGFFFTGFKPEAHQSDLSKMEDPDTQSWGLTFMLPEFLQNELLPENLQIVSRAVGRTGHRHDAYVVRKV